MFSERIRAFNAMYKLPVSDLPTTNVGVPLVERFRSFKNVLSEELNEIDEIVTAAEDIEAGTTSVHHVLTMLTALADLLGDIQVYCASEMAKFGLPQDAILEIIMDSNASKLGADGKPIYDERGKVLKGPNYWKPEPKIFALLEKLMAKRLAQEEAKALVRNSPAARVLGAFDPLPTSGQE